MWFHSSNSPVEIINFILWIIIILRNWNSSLLRKGFKMIIFMCVESETWRNNGLSPDHIDDSNNRMIAIDPVLPTWKTFYLCDIPQFHICLLCFLWGRAKQNTTAKGLLVILRLGITPSGAWENLWGTGDSLWLGKV